jgi:hypothetical protein
MGGFVRQYQVSLDPTKLLALAFASLTRVCKSAGLQSRDRRGRQVDALSGFPYTRFSHPARRSFPAQIVAMQWRSRASTECGVCPEGADGGRIIQRPNLGR